jgi:hypothetical protein
MTWTGLAAARCPGRCLHFRSDTAFDRHQILTDDGVYCFTPEELRRVEKNGKPRLVETPRGWVTSLMSSTDFLRRDE